jgi:hypothetical protein
MNAHTEIPEASEINAVAEVLMRTRVTVDAKLRGRVVAQDLIRDILKPLEDENNEAYAVRLAIPGSIKGAVNIKTYSKTGKNLDSRRFTTHPMPADGNHSLWLYTKASGQACVGIFTSKSLADTIGSLWTSGVIDIEFGK